MIAHPPPNSNPEATEGAAAPSNHPAEAIMMVDNIDDRRDSSNAVTVQNGHVEAVQKGDPKSVELQEVKLTDKGADADKDKSVHLMSSSDVAAKFETSIDLTHPKQSKGLTSAEAATRLQKHGLNQLSPPKELPEIVKYLMYFLDPFMILLLGAGTLSCIAWALDKSQPINLTIGIVLFVITLLSCTFSYFQEGKSADVMKSFKSMLPRNCHCIRDGKEKILPAKELVPGDVIRVATGDQIPADIRVFWSQECKVETSSLTGESVPITMSTSSDEPRLEEAHDVAFNTSQCLEGEMLGVVFATGDNTVIGRIAALASGTDQSDSPLQKEIKYFVRRLTIFAFCLGCIFFTIGAARNPSNLIIAFINGFIVVMIACVPEGLPMTVTSALTITAKRMAMKNVFIKQLRSVETLGSATVIASDKTGTLTQNKMSVSRVWFDFNPMSVEVAMRDMPYSLLKKNASASTLYNLELVACLCNRSHFEDERDLNEQEAQMMEMSMAISQLDPSMTLHSAKRAYPLFLDRIDSSMSVDSAREKFRITQDDSQRKVLGEPSDMALFNFVKSRQSVELMRYHWRKVFEVPFNSRNKYSIVIVKPHLVPNQSRRLLLMKGAPEVILTRCNRWMRYGKAQPIDADFKAHFQQTYEMFGGYGERVLGCAMMELDEKEFPPEMDTKYNLEAGNYPQTDLIFLGLVSLVDPPKASVPPAIEQCRHAGIRVIMVTGDHPLTAAAIARQVGIFTGPTKDQLAKLREVPESEIQEEDVDAIVIKGTDIPNFTEADWHRVLGKREIVFARTTPAQKLQIVEHLQARGEIVASTGDGVNDSPALKKADIGVAMGISGSDVARDAGDVILMDDDFASLVLGIKEGRTIFDNLGKTVSYTITHMVPEIVPVLINLAFGVPLGLSSLLILSIDLGTELAPSISLAYEKSEGDVMDRPPRNSKTDRLVSLNVVGYFMLTGVFYCLICYLAFFLVFQHHGISASDLVFADDYFKTDANPFTSGSKTFTDSQQTTILAEAQAAYWVMLITAQIAHIFLSKTRAASIFVHGIFNNVTMDYGVVIEIAIVLIIVFTPWANAVFGTSTFPGQIWGMIVFLPGLLFLTSEGRKYLYRKYNKSKRWARHLVI